MREEPEFDPEALMDAMAPLLGLDIKPQYRPGIAINLKVTAAFAALVLEAEIDDRFEPAAVFRA